MKHFFYVGLIATRSMLAWAIVCGSMVALSFPVLAEVPLEEQADQEQAIEDLEQDMEDAKKKIQGSQGMASETSTGVFVEAETKQQDNRPLSVRLAESGRGDKNFGLIVVLDHSVGTGTFMQDEILRQSRRYVAQNWDIRPSYSFDFLGHRPKVSARWVAELEMTEPDSNPARRFKPLDLSFALSDSKLFVDPWLGIRLSASVSLSIPSSWESINVAKRYTNMRTGVGLSRAIGPVYLTYGFTVGKSFNRTKGAKVPTDTPLPEFSGIRAVAPGGTSFIGNEYPNGFNSSHELINSFSITYSFTDNLSASYSLLIWNIYKYTQDNVNTADAYMSPYADDGRGRSDYLWPSLELAYVLDSAVEQVVKLPFSLTASAGISALHPAQTSNNKSIRWPLFYNVVGDNQAANNYASYYFALTGVY